MNDKLTLTRAQWIVRIAGALLLTACAAMVILGTTVWEADLHGPRYALYWSWCFLLTLAAIIVAGLDMLLVRRAFKRNRRELYRQEFMTEDFAAKLRAARRRDQPKQ